VFIRSADKQPPDEKGNKKSCGWKFAEILKGLQSISPALTRKGNSIFQGSDKPTESTRKWNRSLTAWLTIAGCGS
jgi:hypothetical protein